MTPPTYRVTFAGQAGDAVRAEFGDCRITVGPATTTLRVELSDQAALSGLIQRVIDLRLRLESVVLEQPDSGGHRPDNPIYPGDQAPASSTELFASTFDVVNRLFSVGLTLTGLQALVGGGAAADRLAGAVDELDDAIRQIRTIAFSVVPVGAAPASGSGERDNAQLRSGPARVRREPFGRGAEDQGHYGFVPFRRDPERGILA
jgi:hypothetical protein